MKKYITRFGKKGMELISRVSPRAGAYILYVMRTHQIPNLRKPKNFNEKLTFLKLGEYAKNDLVGEYADKYSVREYVASKGYADILNDLYGVYDSYDEIDFKKLPAQFALKGTHGCAYNIICQDKSNLNMVDVEKKVRRWLKEKYGYATQELHYTKIKPRMIAEKYLSDSNGVMPLDYKIYCFDGVAKLVLVCTDRQNDLTLNYFDLDWKELSYGKPSYRSVLPIEKPKNLAKMLRIAEDLSVGFPFVRVDLYSKDEKIVFGELTFTPACSCAPYYAKKGLVDLGALLKVST